MDLPLKRDTVRINVPVYEGTADHPVESDVLLPDYCPDIARILKTEADASLSSKALETGCLTVEGSLCVKVVYIPENSGSIRCFTFESPFSHTFEGSGIEKGASARVKVRADYANVRPIGPRRLQIRASVSISAKVLSDSSADFVTDCEDERIEVLKKDIKACSLIGTADKQFTVEEELEIGYGKPAAAAVIKSGAVAMVQDCKVISNKIIVKGELLVKTLYASDADGAAPEVMEHTLPLSQIIDLEGADENSICQVSFSVISLKVEAESDADGENRLLELEAVIGVQASARASNEFSAFTDAYCPHYEMNITSKPVSLEYLADTLRANETVRLAVETGDELSAVTDCSAKADIMVVKAEGSSLVISGEMWVSVMAADMQGGPVCVEKALPFSITQELRAPDGTMRCEPEVTVVNITPSLMAGRIELRADCLVTAMVFGVCSENVITDMEIDESRPKECKQKTLTLYFADKGESLWEIAKRYNTSMEIVRRENNLEFDMLPEHKMLLIPKKRCAKNCR